MLAPPSRLPPTITGTNMKTLVWLVAALCALSGCSEPGSRPVPSAPGSPPNIVLIISDDHFWGDHGFMGHPVVQTPNLDRLAEESMVFTRGYTPTSVCRPSLATMVTGLYPHQHGITGNDPPGDMARDAGGRAEMEAVFERSRTILEHLHADGFLSHQSGKWWEGNPVDHGFTAAMTHGDVTRGGRHGDEGLRIGREGMEPIRQFLESAGQEPFMIYYAPFIPHTPHNPPDSLLEKYQAHEVPESVARYHAMIDWFDLTVGELLSMLEARGLRDGTLVLYAVDNGWLPAIGDQGRFDSRAKMSPYDAGMRTPIMMRWPGVVAPGRDEVSLVSTIDLVPTILAATGASAPPGLPGIDLRDGERLSGRSAAFGALFAHTSVDLHDPAANLKYRYAVRKDGWKLILPHGPNRDVELMINGDKPAWMRLEPELYNVLEDPGEERDLAGQMPGMVYSLRTEIDRWWSVPQ